MSTIKPTSVPSKRLSETISGSAASFKLNNIEGWDGVDLAAADFGTLAYAVFRNSAGTLMEIMEIDPSTIASASITINKRGLKFTGDLATEVAANKLTWIRGDTIVELGSHPPQLFNSYVDLYNEQTITGMKSVPTPTASGHIASKGYVDTLAFGGTGNVDRIIEAGDAGETVAAGNLLYFNTTDNEWKKCDADTLATVFGVKLGIAQGAGTDGAAISGGVLTRGLDTNQTGMTQGDIMFASNTAGGIGSTTGTIPRVIGIARTTTGLYFDPDFLRIPYVYAADSVGSDSYAVTLPEPFNAYYVGMRLTFKAGTANTGACTLAVNGGAAKAIKKEVSVDLVTGDILQNQIVEVVYDGTNFQIVTPRMVDLTGSYISGILPVAKGGRAVAAPFKNGSTTYDISTASGVQNIPHGLGVIPSRVRIVGLLSKALNGLHYAEAVYNGTTQTSFNWHSTANAETGEFGTTFKLAEEYGDADYASAVVTFDATNIILTWTKTGSPTALTATIIWEAMT